MLATTVVFAKSYPVTKVTGNAYIKVVSDEGIELIPIEVEDTIDEDDIIILEDKKASIIILVDGAVVKLTFVNNGKTIKEILKE